MSDEAFDLKEEVKQMLAEIKEFQLKHHLHMEERQEALALEHIKRMRDSVKIYRDELNKLLQMN